MNHITRRLTAGLVATAGALAAAGAIASPTYASIIVHDVNGEPTSGTPTERAAPTDEFGSALIPCF